MKKALVACRHKGAVQVILSSLKGKCDIHRHGNNISLDIIKKHSFDLAFIDIEFFTRDENPNLQSFKDGIKNYQAYFSKTTVIALAPVEKTRQAVHAVKAGAQDYLTYPVDPVEIEHVLANAHDNLRLSVELEHLRDEFWSLDFQHILKTRSPRMRAIFSKMKSVAPTRSTVLLCGETGTGKGVFAKLIHHHSNRREGAFISVHCGALPDNLVESELFGHEKGSFTGAIRKKMGKFELASKGSIFLDEIGTVQKAVQIKLLKVLQERIFQRVGGETDIQTDARIIAATNIDLDALAKQGDFRRDLYYRLNVFPIELLPLRERVEDIPLLCDVFLESLNNENLKEITGIHPQVLEAFNKYSWPGNIRELENLMERAYILETSSVLTPESFPSDLFSESAGEEALVIVDATSTLAEARRKGVEGVERSYLKTLLENNSGKIKLSATAAGVSTRQLHKLLARYGIRKEEFKTQLKTPE